MKKLLKWSFVLILVLVVIFAIILGFKHIDTLKKESNNEKEVIENSKTQEEIDEELLRENMDNAKNLVSSINDEIALIPLRTRGTITLKHDKTPNNNKWTEWLINSDIKVFANYMTTFSIESKLIGKELKNDGTLILSFDRDDIKLSSIDITDIYTSNNKSIFGKGYTPSEVVALENIARDDIKKYTNTDKNINIAINSLKTYFNTLSSNFNVPVNIVEK